MYFERSYQTQFFLALWLFVVIAELTSSPAQSAITNSATPREGDVAVLRRERQIRLMDMVNECLDDNQKLLWDSGSKMAISSMT
jgi:hypothetical protein